MVNSVMLSCGIRVCVSRWRHAVAVCSAHLPLLNDQMRPIMEGNDVASVEHPGIRRSLPFISIAALLAAKRSRTRPGSCCFVIFVII